MQKCTLMIDSNQSRMGKNVSLSFLVMFATFVAVCFVLYGSWNHVESPAMLVGGGNTHFLKQSLRQIVSFSSPKARDDSVSFKNMSPSRYLTQLRNIVGSVLDSTSRTSAPRGRITDQYGTIRSFRSPISRRSSRSSCGESCVEELSSRMLALSHSAGELSSGSLNGRGDNTVGAEIKERAERKMQDSDDRARLLEAVKRRINKSVEHGWKHLGEGLRKDAMNDLHAAEHYHHTLIRLLQGSRGLNDALKTPKNILVLRNALDASNIPVERSQDSSLLTVPHALKIMDTPRKLKEIMEKKFLENNEDDGDEGLSSRHSSLKLSNVGRPHSVKDFEGLMSRELNALRRDIDQGHLRAADREVKKASHSLQAIRNVHDHDISSEARTRKKNVDSSEFILPKYQSDLRNVKVNGNPVVSDLNNDLKSTDADMDQSSDKLDSRQLFQDAIRDGTQDLKLGNVRKAQGKLAEARYYANSEGYLKVDPTYDSVKRHNAQTAQLALKLFAKAILNEESSQHPSRSSRSSKSHSFRSLLESLYRVANRGHSGRHNFDSHSGSIRIQSARRRRKLSGKVTNRHHNSWKTLLNVLEPDVHGDVFAAANGQQEEDSLIQHAAKRKEIADCNTLLCLLPKKSQGEQRGPSLQSMAGLDGIKKSDFSHAKTDFHTGLHLSKRLEHGGIVPKELQNTDPNAGGGSGSLASVSMRDAEEDVLRQEAKDAKKSMAEALVSYKHLLHHEVKKEEKNSLTNPMIAIMAPHGNSKLQLTAKQSNPAGLKLTPTDLLASIGGDPTKKAIIDEALKGHSKEDNELIDKYLKMANINQVKPVPATIKPVPLSSLNSLASVQKTLGVVTPLTEKSSSIDTQPSPAASASQVSPVFDRNTARRQFTSTAGLADAPTAGSDSHYARISARAPPVLRNALNALSDDDAKTIAQVSNEQSAAPRTESSPPANADAKKGGGMVDLLIHDVAQDLGF